MIRPRWEWALDDDTGAPLTAPLSPAFTTQYDAEEWLGEHWRTLAETGAARARLLHDGAQATPTVELRKP
ncbi:MULTISPECIES: hypothetical protein [Isoptericola]|uniref:Uncharacterized protein n=1 Tax=Isoptericola sediminis TaxID=2733572 RepID=A0A849K1A7_9MICO|nr:MULTISPECIES: hypothetical protein [Isoptericola]MDO8145230.1 hypothetical protein [Isoptericola sp. 178]MDO8148868.1 hypothetical protein [Isoptericola sp. b515]MDO8151190.1 hypothetical protein [Isoptericola sp. b408]NNU28534.1 hypothetical protein [Isoptericola sediminis]